MKILVKLIAALIGYALFGLLGAIFAVMAVLLFESTRQNGHRPRFHFVNSLEAQRTFFYATFAIMGCIAKADGRISEQEIRVAQSVMEQMGLSGENKQRAIDAFNEGKQPDFQLEETLEELKRVCRYKYLLQLFLEIQVRTAYAEGPLNIHKREKLKAIIAHFKQFPLNFEAFLYGDFYSGQQDNSAYQAPTSHNVLMEAYQLLGVSAQSSDEEVKKAYRKLMSQNHPDKLVAKGLPENMIKLATEKTQQIQKAYEQIKQARNLP